MAIFRVVKPTRVARSGSAGSASSTSSSSPSSSSSSSSNSSRSTSSDGSSKVRGFSKLKRITAKPAQYLELCDKNTEICQVGESLCRLPQELFHADDLSQILSLDTWNNCLTEEEREQLCTFLPDLDEESFQLTLGELFGGVNINFGNPVVVLMSRLKSGSCNPKATKCEEVLRYFQKVEHYHGLQKYHNDKVRLFGEMHSLWSENPSADIDERMELWHTQCAASGRPVPRLQLAKPKEVPIKGKHTIKLTLRKGRPEGSEEKSANLNMENRTRKRREGGNLSNAMAFEMGDGQMTSRKSFSSLKHSSSPNNTVDNDFRMDVNRKKKKFKGSEKKRFISEMKPNNHDFGISPNRLDSTVKHPSERKIGRSSGLKKQKKSNLKGNRNKKGSNWESFYGSPAKGGLSSSDERDFMADLMSDDETSSRKRTRRSKYDFQDDIPSRASSRSRQMRAGTSYSQALTSTPSGAPKFSFSVLHFLSAVRKSLLGSGQINEQQHGPLVVPFNELLRRIQANPGDLRVLSVREPLEGLLRGALKVLSSKTLRPAAQGWRPLVAHDKSSRGWCWIGPFSAANLPTDQNTIEMDADTWEIPPRMLLKIQEAFISWFNGAQETLLLFAQLGLPPLPLKPFVLNENERFQGLRAQRSLVTVSPTTAEMRAYFQQEEAIRYALQDTVFFYTTACGEKSAVAPLRRLGGKPNSKARDHLVLKSDRPSHVTILYLVRDAAARLPRSLGTRADVAVLLRDSQYIVEDASDAQLSQVVSGALDRLRYERDPCVQFDADRKLWVYLHADREEEDFEDDGTSSTKRWKRGKKDSMDGFDNSGHENALIGEENPDRLPSEVDYNSSPGSYGGSVDMNYTADTPELFYNHHSTSLASSFPGHLRDDGVLPLIDIPASIQSSCTNMQSHPMGWEMYR